MSDCEETIIFYDSKTFQKEFFKKKEKKELIISIFKNHLKYNISPFEFELTEKVNCIKRLILYRKYIRTFLKELFNNKMNYMGDGIIEIIIKYIGISVSDVYINIEVSKYNLSVIKK